MVQRFQIYLFGDQTYEIQTRLHDLLHSNKSPILESFFEQAYCKLRAEAGQLPIRERESYPRFTSIADLLSWRKRQDTLNPAIESALTCIYQLAHFISQHDGVGRHYPLQSETCLSGLCTGALSAAAISCCRTVSELLPVAVETVLIAFRAGLCALRAGRGVDQLTEAWSLVVPSHSPEKLAEGIKKFSRSKHLPLTSQPYISAHALHGLAISGPPGILRDLQSSEEFTGVNARSIRIYAPYHAPHLFNRHDIESVLETTPAKLWEPYVASLPVVSSTTGRLIQATNFRSRLEAALMQILVEPIRWQELSEGVASVLQSTGAPRFNVTPFATNADATLRTALTRTVQSSVESPNEPDDGSHSSFDSASHQSIPGSRPENSKIAIIGMSGRYPSAENNEQFWDLLRQGLDVHKEVPPLHWDVKTHVDVTGTKKNTSATPYGCWLENPAAFDARFFNMSPREAPQVDPAQRIALMTAYEAIEQAGIVPDATPSTRKERVGVFYGVTSNDWMETNSAQNIDTYFIPGGNRAFIPGRLNYFFKFSGPSYSVDTACSSSLAAIHVACNALWKGDIDTAIAGGTNVLTNPDFTAGLDRGHFLSRTGNCKTFDDEADGYCRGEGVGTVILKRLEDALADKDPIQGLILGAYTNHSAETESITRPHVGAQRAIFDKILNRAGIDAYSVSYVEMHGTGTQVGDAAEMSSVLETFAPATARHYRRDEEVLYLGSAKANIGHGEAVSGVTSLAKILLMMQNNVIPPHCGIKTKINHKFPTDLETRNVRIANKTIPWNRAKGQPRRVFLNNFSAAGGNTALLLEDRPVEVATEENDPRTSHLVAISAKCAASLAGNLKSMLDYIDSHHDEPLSLAKLSYTTTSRRIHHLYRVMVRGSTIKEVKNHLETAIARGDGTTRPKSAPKQIFSFTGQGSQFAGMAKQFYDSYVQFRTDIRRFDQIGQALGFPSFKPIFEDTPGTDIRVYSPLVSQLASVCMQMALSRLWAAWGVVPMSVVGHSLGEYAALNVAGVLSDADTVFLVGKRAQLLEENCTLHTHSMMVIKASVSTVNTVLAGVNYEVACINAPEETVIGGANEHINALQKVLKEHGLKTTTIKVPYAYHSSQVDAILDDFETAAKGATFHKPAVPVISPMLGKVITEAGVFGSHYLRRHCREAVNFLDAIRFAWQNQTITERCFVIEIGAHSVVTGLMKAILGSQITAMPTLQRKRDDWEVLTEIISSLYCAGMDLRWAEYHRDFKSSQQVLQLTAYSWNLKNYWMQYVNDWSLRKGDPPVVAPAVAPLESTTIHKVLEDSLNELVVESDIARPDLNPLVQGHAVDGIPLCTPSVYADIALTLGKHWLDRYQPASNKRLVDIADMTIQKALIAKPEGYQPLRTFVTFDWATMNAKCRFVSLDNKGEATIQHAHCTIQFTDRSRLNVLERTAQEIKRRMADMKKGLESGKTQRFNRVMVYKMINPLAQFHADYRAIDEVIIDSKTLEASSRVNFRDVKATGTFNTHPAYIDGLTQSGGFIMNCNDGNDLDVEVFVNHGWKSFQLYEPLSANNSYSTFVQMFEKEGRMYEGDVTIFEGDKIAASYKGIALQGVPRRVLRYVLSVEGGRKPQIQPLSKKNLALGTAVVPTNRLAPVPIVTKKPEVMVTVKPMVTVSATVESALRIISEESGIVVAEMTDDCLFSDIGIDSLLSLVITSRFREELKLDIELDDMFTTCPAVKDLKELLAPGGDKSPASSEAPVVVEVEIVPQSPIVQTVDVGIDADFDAALAIISEESGVPVSDLTDDCVFSDIGIDSLLSLVMVSRFRAELALDMDLESVFTDYPSVKHLKGLFGGGESGNTTRSPSVKPDSSDRERPGNSSSATSKDSDSEEEMDLRQARTHVPAASSVFLQGLPKNAQKTLFLFPDGAGSATSYSGIPRVGTDVAVVGLNSPYHKNPAAFKCTVDELIDSYVEEVRRRQPNGPYNFGGWSAGGILAYRATQQMIEAGEVVQNLLLIDSPVPKGLDRLPKHFYDFCNQVHLFGNTTGSGATSKPPDWLVPHFNATIDTLHTYFADSLPRGKTPKTSLIWACDSVMDGKNIPKMPPHPDDTEGMKFLTEARTDFSGNGWEALFPGGKILIERAVGANHFSMMRGEYAPKLAGFISEALECR